MKEKIINIRNILKIIISLFVIFAMIKSCSKAYTWDELLDFAEQVSVDTSATVRQRSLANMLLDHSNGWTNYLTEQIGNLNNIKGIFVFYTGGLPTDTTDRVDIWVWTYIPNLDFSGSSGSGISPTSGKRANYGLEYIASNGKYYNNVSTGGSMYRNYGFGLVETSNTSTIYSGWYLQNRYTPRPALDFVPMGDGDITVDGIQHVQKLRINKSYIGWIKNWRRL